MGKLVTEPIGGVTNFSYASTGYITKSKRQDLDRKRPELLLTKSHANTATDNHQQN